MMHIGIAVRNSQSLPVVNLFFLNDRGEKLLIITDSTIIVIFILNIVKDYIVFFIPRIHDSNIIQFGCDMR